MPIVRKIDPAIAATWSDEPDADPAHLLAQLADRTGLTRIERPGPDGGERAWRARVYRGGRELHRQFADAALGGTAAALQQAVAWRDATRAAYPRLPRPSGRTWRIVRAEYDRNRGWLAYADRRRYFADGKYGGPDGAKAAAEAWLAARRE